MTHPVTPLDEPAASGTEHVGLAFRALAFGIALGVAFQAMVTFGVRTLVGGSQVERPAFGSPPVMLLLGGTFVGLLAAGIATGSVLTPIRNLWRQAMFGVVAAFASFALSLITIPVYQAFGRTGLLALAAAFGVACFGIGRSLARWTPHP
jgi:hypothetical protein